MLLSIITLNLSFFFLSCASPKFSVKRNLVVFECWQYGQYLDQLKKKKKKRYTVAFSSLLQFPLCGSGIIFFREENTVLMQWNWQKTLGDCKGRSEEVIFSFHGRKFLSMRKRSSSQTCCAQEALQSYAELLVFMDFCPSLFLGLRNLRQTLERLRDA